MATVANLKAKLVMDIGEFEKNAERAVGKASTMGKTISSLFSKAGKQYSDALKNAVVGAFGVQALDAGLRNVGEALKNLDYRNVNGLNDVFKGISTSLGETARNLPVLGSAFTFGEGLATAMNFGGLRDSSVEAAKAADRNKALNEGMRLATQFRDMNNDITFTLERQLQLAQATTDVEKLRVQREFERKDLQDKIERAGRAINENEDNIAYRVKNAVEAYDKMVKAQDEALERQREAHRIAQEQAEQQRMIEQEDRAASSFLENLQSQYDAITLSERERLELQMQRLKLWPEEIEAATKLYEQIQRAKELQDEQRRMDDLKAKADEEAAQNRKIALEAMDAADRASSVETLDTAIGGVKVQGMMDASLSRLVPLQEAQKAYLKAIADNTKPAAGGAP